MKVHSENDLDKLGISRLESNTLELLSDEAAGLAKQRRKYVWDKRKKNYVQVG